MVKWYRPLFLGRSFASMLLYSGPKVYTFEVLGLRLTVVRGLGLKAHSDSGQGGSRLEARGSFVSSRFQA